MRSRPSLQPALTSRHTTDDPSATPDPWLSRLASLCLEALEAEGRGVIDPRAARPLRATHPADAEQVGPAVPSALRLTDLMWSLGLLRRLLAEERAVLCVERREDGCALWAGRLRPTGGSAASALPTPRQDGGGGRRVRLAA